MAETSQAELDTLQLINSLDPARFELLVADIARATFPDAQIGMEVAVGSFNADIVIRSGKGSDEIGTSVVIEAKRVHIATINLIASQVARRDHLRASYPDIQYLLVISGQLTPAAANWAAQHQLRVWDGRAIVTRLTSELRLKWFGIADPSVLPQLAGPSRAQTFQQTLGAISPGKAQALDYQKWVADVFEYLFVPPLGPVHYEDPDDSKRNRRDLILENWAPDGFWAQMRTAYRADQVVVDAKNYAGKIKKRPVLDLAHYLKPYGCGMFGILCSREGADESAIHAIREHWIGSGKLIMSVSDKELMEMVALKESGTRPEEILRRRIADFRKRL
jgi:hypothetical protein